MFEFLANIDDSLLKRYSTLERNVKAASNSFYDSYLDMLEQFIKTVLETEGIEIKANETCGAVLKRNEVKDLFINTFGISGAFIFKSSNFNTSGLTSSSKCLSISVLKSIGGGVPSASIHLQASNGRST